MKEGCPACRYSTRGHCANHPEPKVRPGDEVDRMLVECDEADRDASGWEIDFLESIRTTKSHGSQLTPKQLAKLQQVHERLTGAGSSDESEC